jgi:hypothetical protein
MSTRTADRSTSDLRGADLRHPHVDRDLLRRRLLHQRHELEAQMRQASRELHRLRTTSDVSDPDVQPALMGALRSLDRAEREAIEVSFALARLDVMPADRPSVPTGR